MATVTDLLKEHTAYDDDVVAHLQRLVASWGTLSDLCFADLLLFAPVEWSADRFVILGQVRPTTNRTLHLDDLVGRVVTDEERPLVGRGWRLGSVVEGEIDITSRNERARMVCIPVRWRGQPVAVLTRESALAVGRRPGELERAYVEVFDRLARMIANGEFPFPVDEEGEAPRVGDGVLVLDASGRVEFASPNAVNALHRMGLYNSIEGLRFDEAGLTAAQEAVDIAFAQQLPASREVIQGPDAVVLIRCVPLLDHGHGTGAFVLLQDVTELRRRDRLLLSKDAAIREVHHRVKNNLQTISSLLRLQARRLPDDSGRHALEEAERRVRSIAIVHEILSRDTADQVHFNDILPSLVRMAEDLGSADDPVRITTHGDAGNLQAAIATPLAVVITELLQNAAEHAFPEAGRGVPEHGGGVGAGRVRSVPDGPSGPDSGPGDLGDGLRVDVGLSRRDGELLVVVRDNGVGLPADFRIDDTPSLGLSIVRNLVGTQLGGRIDMRTDGGTVVELIIPLDVVDDDLENL